jgi:nicotinamide-nucleotide amidase
VSGAAQDTPDARIGTLAVALGAALLARDWMAATAESCTGGLVAGAITDVAGSSGWFDRGFVTYSNDAKEALLGVPAPLIVEHGAVSEPVARAMAEGALARSAAHVAVAITGIAGPGGATPGKPVGMVCFAFASRTRAAKAVTHFLQGDRAAVRRASVAIALEGLIGLANEG